MKMKRAEANDPIALCQFGRNLSDKGDFDGAFKYWTKAAELGNVVAHYNLSIMYQNGMFVEKKEWYHLEEAAIGGHPQARSNLACYEHMKGRIERAVKH